MTLGGIIAIIIIIVIVNKIKNALSSGYSESNWQHDQDILANITAGKTCDNCNHNDDDDCPWYENKQNRPVSCRLYS